ncbi:40S ribosomal S15A [Tubulinosema ratisbonensis]|uniref:40S ribosomal S15A n=1 Tax=Tubulinosema ratisbonensis TaxID=291195 RepID=A0A437ANK9_9MICR|nr:40S ribosomal S15A [Tubulinosema ratisbonensis]
MMNKLTATCKAINNANRRGKKSVLIRFTDKITRPFLEKMQKCGYIGNITYIKDNREGKVVVELTGRLNKCGSICPNYHLKFNDVESFRSKLLPARQFGHLILTCDKGIIDHNEAITYNTGGMVLGYFY